MEPLNTSTVGVDEGNFIEAWPEDMNFTDEIEIHDFSRLAKSDDKNPLLTNKGKFNRDLLRSKQISSMEASVQN